MKEILKQSLASLLIIIGSVCYFLFVVSPFILAVYFDNPWFNCGLIITLSMAMPLLNKGLELLEEINI